MKLSNITYYLKNPILTICKIGIIFEKYFLISRFFSLLPKKIIKIIICSFRKYIYYDFHVPEYKLERIEDIDVDYISKMILDYGVLKSEISPIKSALLGTIHPLMKKINKIRDTVRQNIDEANFDFIQYDFFDCVGDVEGNQDFTSYRFLSLHDKAIACIRNPLGKIDKGMIDIFNVECILESLEAKFLNNLYIHTDLIAKKVNPKFERRNLNIYVNDGVTHTRGPHIDSIAHPGEAASSMKVFIYLTKVETKNGPYVYYPKSNGMTNLLWINYLFSTLFVYKSDMFDGNTTDMAFFDPNNGVKLTGSPGDVIFSLQNGVHFGFPQGGLDCTRFALVLSYY